MTNIKRKTIFDYVVDNPDKNIFCDKKDLTNEASVETFFLNRLIKDLGYNDRNIKTKESLSKLQVSKGSKKFLYRPERLSHNCFWH